MCSGDKDVLFEVKRSKVKVTLETKYGQKSILSFQSDVCKCQGYSQPYWRRNTDRHRDSSNFSVKFVVGNYFSFFCKILKIHFEPKVATGPSFSGTVE